MESAQEIHNDSTKSKRKTNSDEARNVTVSVPVCLTMLVDVEVDDIDVEFTGNKLHGTDTAGATAGDLEKIVKAVAADPMIETVVNELIATALRVRFERQGTRVFITSFAGVSPEVEI